MLADGHHRSILRFVTARVLERAVAINEINSKLLKARMLVFGHQIQNGVLRLPGWQGGQ